MDEVRIASSSSSPSRRFSALPRLGSRSGKVAFTGCSEEDEGHGDVWINGVRSPWTSNAASPISTPGTSVVHGYFDNEGGVQASRCEKKRISWLTSMPASYLTPRSASGSEGSLPPTGGSRKKLHSRTSSSSSGSGNSVRPNFDPKAARAPAESSADAAAHKTNPESDRVMSLVPNAQFLALMLLMILIISSPLIKFLSVLLFAAIVVLDA